MIAPCWPTSAWYPTLLFFLFDHPILLRRSPICWRWTGDEIFLAAWPVSDSGDNLVVLGFLCKQPISSLVTSLLLGVAKVLWLVWFKTSLSSSGISSPRSKVSYPRVWYQQVLSCYKYVLFSVVLSTPANKWKTCWAASNHSSLAQRNFKQYIRVDFIRWWH